MQAVSDEHHSIIKMTDYCSPLRKSRSQTNKQMVMSNWPGWKSDAIDDKSSHAPGTIPHCNTRLHHNCQRWFHPWRETEDCVPVDSLFVIDYSEYDGTDCFLMVHSLPCEEEDYRGFSFCTVRHLPFWGSGCTRLYLQDLWWITDIMYTNPGGIIDLGDGSTTCAAVFTLAQASSFNETFS
jgi:hypothetical protein